MSITINYTSEDFPSPGFNASNGTLVTTWSELLHAALTVGRPNLFEVFQHGDSSYYEAIQRLATIKMALTTQSGNSHLHRTAAFLHLDPTEKGFVTYHIGMVFCALFARRLLSADALVHLDVYRDILSPELLSGRSRPDLVGFDLAANALHAFEAKGRSASPSDEDKEKAKEQANRLLRVGRVPCTYNVGSFAYFSGERLRFYWRDPDVSDAEILDLPEPGDRWRYCFEPTLGLLRSVGISADDFIQPRAPAYIKELDLHVSLDPDIAKHLAAGEWELAIGRSVPNAMRLSGREEFDLGIQIKAGDSWDDHRSVANEDR